MDPVKTGKFIAALRKEAGLTQEQFGQKLCVTNKTVSRWETGTYLPPADALLAMSQLFGVSINEILSGKRLTAAEYPAAAEQNLAQAVKSGSFSQKERIAFYRQKWLKEHTAVLIFLGICILAVFAAGLVLQRPAVSYCAVLLALLAHIWRHNTMMVYIEAKAYDGTGPD